MGMPYHILDCISAISGANISPLLAFALTGPFSFVFLTSHFLHCFPFLPRVLTLLVGWQEGHPACKKLVGYWYGYLSGARCSVCVCVFSILFFCSFFSRSFRLLAREIQQKVCEAF